MVHEADSDECKLWRRNRSKNFSCDHSWMTAKSNSHQRRTGSQQSTYGQQRKEGIAKECT